MQTLALEFNPHRQAARKLMIKVLTLDVNPHQTARNVTIGKLMLHAASKLMVQLPGAGSGSEDTPSGGEETHDADTGSGVQPTSSGGAITHDKGADSGCESTSSDCKKCYDRKVHATSGEQTYGTSTGSKSQPTSPGGTPTSPHLTWVDQTYDTGAGSGSQPTSSGGGRNTSTYPTLSSALSSMSSGYIPAPAPNPEQAPWLFTRTGAGTQICSLYSQAFTQAGPRFESAGTAPRPGSSSPTQPSLYSIQRPAVPKDFYSFNNTHMGKEESEAHRSQGMTPQQTAQTQQRPETQLTTETPLTPAQTQETTQTQQTPVQVQQTPVQTQQTLVQTQQTSAQTQQATQTQQTPAHVQKSPAQTQQALVQTQQATQTQQTPAQAQQITQGVPGNCTSNAQHNTGRIPNRFSRFFSKTKQKFKKLGRSNKG
ncbi:uncharacterized protein ATNIH1004_010319 [Aspergillus tanneri]|uniref:Uncharacterized protein n=1 Tax=Aspergillus tanneri TaxID=1220188 RepID=A0A5M9MDL9_9EURO|nr:uncharacterized protein ATNIH1004_010319 [Aspergillus tanneri]KAA8643550.1 hypothetical protein ATNIH1004_010319 [Aspergillus tanneri]